MRCARLEIFLKQSRRDKILVTPHKAKPQCGAKTRCGASTPRTSGDSAQRWRVARNGARHHNYKGIGGGETWRTLRRRLPPAPISPCFLRRAPPFRCERSEQAEPPTITTQVSPRKSQIANRPRKKRPPFREALGIHRINVLLIFNTSQRSAIAFRSILGRIFLSSTYIQGYCITIRHNTP